MSVTGGVHFDLVKRVFRDIQRAGQEPEEIIHQISETVTYSYYCLVFKILSLNFVIFKLIFNNVFYKFPHNLHIFSS